MQHGTEHGQVEASEADEFLVFRLKVITTPLADTMTFVKCHLKSRGNQNLNFGW